MRFELLRKLGEGASGVVYQARDAETGATVAVKQLRPETVVPEHELLLARKVTHDNVCRVYDLYREDGITWISMEFVDGEPLHGSLPVEKALLVACQICEGLAAIHRHGIVHRDVKPANILLCHDGTVKVTDFGLARLLDSDATASAGARVSSGFCGTPAYMSPEQLRGERATVRSDIYALGLVLTELGLEGPAVSRCVERRPAKRFASALDVRDALMAPFIPKPAKRFQRVLAAGTVTALAAAAFFGWSKSENVARVKPSVVPAKPSVAVLLEDTALTAALVRGGKFRVVERVELEKVLAELKLNRQKAFDEVTAQQVGHLVGAEYLIAGGRQEAGGAVLINLRLIQTETGVLVDTQRGSDVAVLAKGLGESLGK